MDKIKIRTMRLQKEEISLEKEPIENALVKREGELKFFYCLYNLEDDFKHGFYFGLLQLHQGYPFAAPKLFMYTPNGRYEVNMAICTSFTNYHQESWTSAWNVRSLIQATISFMYANEPSYGCRADSSEMRKKYARDSLQWNMENQQFRGLFGQTINAKLTNFLKLGIHIFDKNLSLEIRKLGLEEENKQNLGQMAPVNRGGNYPHRIQEIRNRLDDPLIINQEAHIELRQNGQLQNLHDEIQNQRLLIAEQKRKKKEKVKKIIKIIGYIAVAAAFGAFVYYNWIKPSSEVASSQTTSLTNPDSSIKQKGIFNSIIKISKNVYQYIPSFKKNADQKVLIRNQ